VDGRGGWVEPVDRAGGRGGWVEQVITPALQPHRGPLQASAPTLSNQWYADTHINSL
jgi:hypothetical protein